MKNKIRSLKHLWLWLSLILLVAFAYFYFFSGEDELSQEINQESTKSVDAPNDGDIQTPGSLRRRSQDDNDTNGSGSDTSATVGPRTGQTVSGDNGDRVDAQTPAIIADIRQNWPIDIVESLSAAEVTNAEALEWVANAGSSKLVSKWAVEGSYYASIDNCESAYNHETNVLSGYCVFIDGDELTEDFFQWTNVASSGYHSDKYTQTLATGVVPTYLGLSSAFVSGRDEGLLSEALRSSESDEEFEETVCSEYDSLVDAASGLALAGRCVSGENNEIVLQATRLSTGSKKSVNDAVADLESRVADASFVSRQDWGFEQLTIGEVDSKVSYQLPKLSQTITDFELAEVFYAPKPKLAEANNIAASKDLVVQVYRNGFAEVVVTSRPSGTKANWTNDPIAIGGERVALSGAGWSDVVAAPSMPPHFWGLTDDAVVTVEGYNVDSATLESLKAALAN